MARLYELVEKSEQSPKPKRALFSVKCPKCGSKLARDSAKGPIFASEEGNEFAKKVAAKAELDPGVYTLTIDHFTCKQCGYDFAKAEVAAVSD